MWKLASYERAFPWAFRGAGGYGSAAAPRPLCDARVMDQLRLRYEREHNQCVARAAMRSISLR